MYDHGISMIGNQNYHITTLTTTAVATTVPPTTTTVSKRYDSAKFGLGCDGAKLEWCDGVMV
jgi:hypothetical protein